MTAAEKTAARNDAAANCTYHAAAAERYAAAAERFAGTGTSMPPGARSTP